jgi:hypothetical protein
MPGLADLVATAGLAMDDPHEGSGPARGGLGRLQHMNGSRCRALALWDRGRWVAALVCRRSCGVRRCRCEVAGGAGGWAAIAGAAGRDRSWDRVAAFGACDGRAVCGTSCVPSVESLTSMERAALAGAPEGTRLEVVSGSGRAGVDADRSVLRPPRARRVPGVLRQGRGPAPVLAPARQARTGSMRRRWPILAACRNWSCRARLPRRWTGGCGRVSGSPGHPASTRCGSRTWSGS